MTEKQERYQYIDIARGIAMLCIIIGHLGNGTINRIVFTFHVPIFFLITGFFMSEERPPSVKRKFRTLIVPYFCTCLLIIAIGALKGYMTGGAAEAWRACSEWTYAALYGAGDSYTEPFYIKAIGAIWFLWATFWGSIFMKLAFKLRHEFRLLFIVILFLFGYYSRALFWFPLSFQAGCCATLFMYAGYLCRKAKTVVEAVPNEVKNASALFALIVWLCFMRDFQSFWLVHCDIGRGVTDLFGSLCGCYIVLAVSRLIEKHIAGLRDGLAFIGKYSIFVLCVHIIELNLFPWEQAAGQMIGLGMPAALQLPFIIAGKYIMDIGVTVLCVHVKPVRKLFGLKA